MVTDAVTDRPKVETAFPYGARLVLTLLVLALYWFGHRIPLPFVTPELQEIYPELRSRIGILALGITPLFNGFLLVELFSLVTSRGRDLRRSGAAGRARLNRAALITSLLIAALQAMGIARSLEFMSSPSGPIVEAPGFWFSLLTVATLTAMTAALFVLGQLLSAYGIGNGFALFAFVTIASKIVNGVAGGQKEIEDIPAVGYGLPVVAGLAVLVFLLIRKSEDRWTPAFPQSILPAQWVAWTPWLLTVFGLSFQLAESKAVRVWLPLIAIPLLSWLAFQLFSSRPRLETDLSEPEETLDDLAQSLRRQALPATALLTLGAVAILAWQEYWPGKITFAFSFPQIVIVIAIALDVWDQYRFQQRHGRTALLAQLDNVHFSYRLEELLQEAEIPALARGHQLRSLTFFFGALYKIDVLVPEEELDRARGVLAELEMAREIKAF